MTQQIIGKSNNINFSIYHEKNRKISKKLSKCINFINKRFSKGSLTTLADLEQYVNSNKNKKAATRKLASRLCGTGLIESANGVYLPKGQASLFANINKKSISKINKKREKDKFFTEKKQFLDQIRPIIIKNKWSYPTTYLAALFTLNNIFNKISELNIFHFNNDHYEIPFTDKEYLPDLKIIFKIYSNNNIVIKIGNKENNQIQANPSIISSALFLCHKFLISTNKFWELNLEVPSIRKWILNIPYIYSHSTNENPTNTKIDLKDDDLGIQLLWDKKYLTIISKLPRKRIKANQLHDIISRFNPLTNLTNPTIFENQSQSVTICKNFENSKKDSLLMERNN